MKRLIAFALVLVMVLTLCATAFAANPSASVVSKYKSQTVKRGKTVKWEFQLKCGSYKRKGSTWRASFDSYIAKGGKKGTIYASTYTLYFTGNGKHTVKWKVPKTVPTGKYTLGYYTSYRDNKGRWHATSTKTAKLTVK
ncbi:MAG: hypothetical protein IKS46_03260 [Clostridia bacterium]|jgi:hypothetical protein|nr:hypothetical protein [Clostridia bacterium]